jgi:glucokinase
MAAEGDALACEAVDIFLAIVGAEAGAMALRCLARGARGRGWALGGGGGGGAQE